MVGLKPPYTKRFFARLVTSVTDHIPSEIEKMMVESFNSLYLAVGQEEQAALNAGKRPTPPNNNQIFLNFLAANTVVEPALVGNLLRNLMTRYADKLLRLGVITVELKLVCRLDNDTTPVALRLVASNPTGYVLRVETYVEIRQENGVVFKTVDESGKAGELEGLSVSHPYPVTRPFERQRMVSDKLQGLYQAVGFI